MNSYLSKRTHWWVLVDRQGRLVCEFSDKNELSVYSTRKQAAREAEWIKYEANIDVTPQKIEVVVQSWPKAPPAMKSYRVVKRTAQR